MRSWCLERLIVDICVRAQTLTPEFGKEPSDEARPKGGREQPAGGHSASKNVVVSAYL